MKKLLLLGFLFNSLINLYSQENLNKLPAHKSYDNILVKRIGGDNLSTQFVIWVKDTVRTHRHEEHSEALYVLSGQGTFYMEDKKFTVEKGDFVSVPKKTWHAVKVTSSEPLKVISVQSPAFYGEDRTFKN